MEGKAVRLIAEENLADAVGQDAILLRHPQPCSFETPGEHASGAEHDGQERAA